MNSIALDTRTMLVVLALATSCLGLAAFAYGRSSIRSEAIRQYGIGLLLGSLSAGLLVLRGIAPDFVSIILANAMAFIAAIFMLRAVHMAFGTPANMWFQYAVILWAMSGYMYYTYVKPDLPSRVMLYSTAFLMAYGQLLLMCLRAWPQFKGRPLALFMGSLILLLAANILRLSYYMITSPPGQDYMAPAWISTFMHIAGLVFVTAGTVAFILCEVHYLHGRLENAAMRDALTGLHNRRGFYVQAKLASDQALSSGQPLSMLMFDLDQFKTLNDTFGHHACDRLLRSAARVIQANAREHDVVARMGGEEFVMLLPNTGLNAASTLAQNVRIALAGTGVQSDDGRAVSCTVSAGIASSTSGAPVGWEVLYKRADRAMYLAKAAGRNQCVVWNDDQSANDSEPTSALSA
jgi:diguanylate cyclase (GGDEF)-like protein